VPPHLRAAVRAEFRRAFRSPYEAPIAVVVNGVLMTAAWLLLPVGLVFERHGALFFPMALAAWMLADVPATNVLGPDRLRAARALDDPDALRRLLYAKNIVLWTLVAPFCTTVALVIGALTDRRLTSCLLTASWILLVPVGALGVSAWVGILFPYHPRPLVWRWANRRSFRRVIVRWLSLAIAPYFLVTWIAVAVLLPSYVLAQVLGSRYANGRLPWGPFALILVSAVIVSAVVFFGGHRVGLRLARQRRAGLRAYLADPDRG
jgi:hypothetical protein